MERGTTIDMSQAPVQSPPPSTPLEYQRPTTGRTPRDWSFAGLRNGVLVALADVQPIIATLILMVAGRGVAQLLTGGQVITFSHPRFEYFGTGFLLGFPFPIFIVLAAALLTGWLARGTALG